MNIYSMIYSAQLYTRMEVRQLSFAVSTDSLRLKPLASEASPFFMEVTPGIQYANQEVFTAALSGLSFNPLLAAVELGEQPSAVVLLPSDHFIPEPVEIASAITLLCPSAFVQIISQYPVIVPPHQFHLPVNWKIHEAMILGKYGSLADAIKSNITARFHHEITPRPHLIVCSSILTRVPGLHAHVQDEVVKENALVFFHKLLHSESGIIIYQELMTSSRRDSVFSIYKRIHKELEFLGQIVSPIS